jgi:hypothetical protein
MTDKLITKAGLAERWETSEKSINTACSRSPENLPKFFKLGLSKNSQIRFRIEDVLVFETEMLERQQEEQAINAQRNDLAEMLNR